MTVALFTHPACLGHDNGPGHPERPDRLRAVLRALESEVFSTLAREEAPEATLEQLAYGSENGTWRNFFLSGATELREGNFGTPTTAASRTAGCAMIKFSMSIEEIHSPPLLMTSLMRSVSFR